MRKAFEWYSVLIVVSIAMVSLIFAFNIVVPAIEGSTKTVIDDMVDIIDPTPDPVPELDPSTFPTLAPSTSWYCGTSKKSTITKITIVDSYTPTNSENESWPAATDADGDGNLDSDIMCYVTGTELTIAGNGSGGIKANENSRYAFAGTDSNTQFKKVTVIEGFELLYTGDVRDMSYMLFNFGFSATEIDLSSLGSWNVSNVTDMNNMFNKTARYAKNLVLDLSNWNVGNVTNMESMFSNFAMSGSLSLDISAWNVSKVTNMNKMFYQTGAYGKTFVLDVSGWQLGNLTMSKTFYCTGQQTDTFEIKGLGDWNTAGVSDMSNMFEQAGCEATAWSIGDLSGWNVSNVTTMYYMFYQTCMEGSTFDIGDIIGWNTGKVTNMEWMFHNAGYKATYFLDLSGWDVSSVIYDDYFNLLVEDKIVSPF